MKNNDEVYMQFTFREFATLFPELAITFPMFKTFIKDDKYIVKIKGNTIEVGYFDDAWLIK